MRRALLIGGGWLLAACSSGVPKPKPAELRPIARSVISTAWEARIGRASIGFRPAVHADRLYAASVAGELACLESGSGREIWRIDTGARLIGGVGADADLVIVASRDGRLLAHGGDGTRRWEANVGSEVISVPAVGEGMVVVRSSDNRISAWDGGTGRRRWSFQRQSPSLALQHTSVPVISDGTVFSGLPGGRIVALGLHSGAVRWEGSVSQPRGSNEIERIADVVGEPSIGPREACAVSFQGRVACFERGGGRALWARDLSSARGLAGAGRAVVATDTGDRVHAFTRDGASLWRSDALQHRGLSAPAVTGALVLVGDATGWVHALSLDDGTPVGRAATDGSLVLYGPMVSERMAVVQTAKGGLFGIGFA